MKKFTVKATALAIASVCGSAAFAGDITSPATDSAAVKYAVEALTAATELTLPNVVYTLGVNRTATQDFTVIVTPSAGATFKASTCATAVPTFGAAFTDAAATVKRASTTECAYEIDVSTTNANAVTAGATATLTFSGLVLSGHTLNTAGNSASVSIALKDLGETAFIDNSAAVTRKVATAVQAVNVYANASDTGTKASVNAAGGPLTGFIVANDDTATVAMAQLTFDNNSVGAKNAAGANFDFKTTTGTVALTLTGPTTGLKANKFCINLDGDGNLCETGEVFTATDSSAVLTAIPSSVFPAAGATTTKDVTFEADGTTQLGTSRTFALTGTVTPQVGAAESLADTNGKNSTWWVWSADASQLVAPYMSTNAKYVTRFSLLNTGTSAVGYSVQCYAEGSNVATNGANGTLKANGTTIIEAANACSFSDTTKPRGAVVFTINAPINTVKGAYNIVDATTGANGFVPMVRPYDSTKTTE